jgi:hypothetical protein
MESHAAMNRHACLALVALLLLPLASTACGDTETPTAPAAPSSQAGSGGEAGAGGGAGGAGGSGPGGSSSVGGSGVGPAGAAGEGGLGGASGLAGAGGGDAGAAGAGEPGKTPERFLAVRNIRLGDVDADGNKSTTEWPTIGLDLDGLQSSLGSKPHCKPAAMGKVAAIQEDGEGGIDNSFGRNIVPLFAIATTPPTLSLAASIKKGDFALLLGLAGFPDGDTGEGIDGGLFAARGPRDADGKIKGPTDAQWDEGSYTWEVLDSLLASQSPLITDVRLPGGKLEGDVWTTQPAELTLAVPIGGVSLTLKLHGGRVRATFSPDHQRITQGVIGGVLYTDEFVAEFIKIGPKLTPLLCNAGVLDSIVVSLQQASDILKDQTQDSDKECDAISIGLAFDAQAALAGQVVPPDMPVETPCP